MYIIATTPIMMLGWSFSSVFYCFLGKLERPGRGEGKGRKGRGRKRALKTHLDATKDPVIWGEKFEVLGGNFPPLDKTLI